MAIQPYQEDSNVSNPVKRIRWATQRVTGSGARGKRHGIIDRFHKRMSSSEKNKGPGEESQIGMSNQDRASPERSDGGQDSSQRRIFFNLPLPEDAKDEEGRPLAKFGRNKIRTAKYTPLSFVPKNLWFQFHNVANIYFFFLIILGVRGFTLRCLLPPLMCNANRSSLCSVNPILGWPRSH